MRLYQWPGSAAYRPGGAQPQQAAVMLASSRLLAGWFVRGAQFQLWKHCCCTCGSESVATWRAAASCSPASLPRPLGVQALEKLSHDHPASLLRNGALVAVLSYVDFFQVCASFTGARSCFICCNTCTRLLPMVPSNQDPALTPKLPALVPCADGRAAGGCGHRRQHVPRPDG